MRVVCGFWDLHCQDGREMGLAAVNDCVGMAQGTTYCYTCSRAKVPSAIALLTVKRWTPPSQSTTPSPPRESKQPRTARPLKVAPHSKKLANVPPTQQWHLTIPAAHANHRTHGAPARAGPQIYRPEHSYSPWLCERIAKTSEASEEASR